MPIVATHELDPSPSPLTPQIYNALDCCLTFEIYNALQQLFNTPPEIYSFSRALQAPVLEMMLRGFCIDQYERQRTISFLRGQLARANIVLQRLAGAIWDFHDVQGNSLNPRSQQQLQAFFYSKSPKYPPGMNLQEIWTSQKGRHVLSMDRETLEKLEIYFHARPIITAILSCRDLAKQITTLESEVDPDGRMRTAINIGGTETGRFSSSKSPLGTGTNFNNIEDHLRRMFVADPGWKICGIDLEQAESREVGWLCGVLFDDWSYLDACEGGDLHTATAQLIWPKLPWTNDPKHNRLLADTPFYRGFSYRDMSKRGGHGSTYLGTPFTMARHLKVPTKLMVDFQAAFFSTFPAIPRWHQWTATQLQTTQVLITPFGRTRYFFGRPNDDATLREAVAFVPQSTTADRLNLGLYRIWKHMGTRVQLLTQLYDAVYFQYREDDNEAEIIAQAQAHLDVPLTHNGRRFSVPSEAKVGWNWASSSHGNWVNPDGLKKWQGLDLRKRTPILDRLL